MLLKSKIDNLKTLIKSENVLTSLEERYCYSTDANNLETEQTLPDIVFFAETVEDVQKIIQYANIHKIPVVSRGAGTNMVGACTCNKNCIVLNFSKMNKILDFNPSNLTIKVQPGVILGDIKKTVEEQGLFVPPDPSNYRVSTIGGAIAQSSGGAMSFKYGTIKDYILSLKVITADGTLVTLGAETIKDTMGYHLNQLIVGSEGTLAVVVEATLKLIPKPQTKALMAINFANNEDAIEAVNEIFTKNIFPATIEFLDSYAIKTINDYQKNNIFAETDCMLLIELHDFKTTVQEQVKILDSIFRNKLANKIEVALEEEKIEKLWQARCSSYAATAQLAPDVISDDIIVPRNRIFKMLNYCKHTTEKYGLKMCLIGHIGDGNLHPQIALNLEDEKEFKNYMAAKSEIYEKVFELGGTVSSEHGVGLTKRDYLKFTVDSKAVEYMKQIKKIFDPNNILNPDKIFKL